MKKARQIAAIVGIVILVGLYIVTLIAAINASEYTHGLFMASLFSSLVIPVMIYVFTRLYKMTHKEGSVSLRKARKMAKEMGEPGAEEKFMNAANDASKDAAGSFADTEATDSKEGQ